MLDFVGVNQLEICFRVGMVKLKPTLCLSSQEFDITIEIPTPDFVEIVGRVGGDIVTYRVYDDGSVYEK